MRVNICLMLLLLVVLVYAVITGVQGALASDQCGMQLCDHPSLVISDDTAEGTTDGQS